MGLKSPPLEERGFMVVKDVEGEHRKARGGLKAGLQADTEKPVVWSRVVTQIWVIAGGCQAGHTRSGSEAEFVGWEEGPL